MAMHAASRESLGALTKRFNEQVSGADASALAAQASDLTSVIELLNAQVTLRKHLAARVDDNAPKQALVARLFGNKVGASTVEFLQAAVNERWSSSRDFVSALAVIARECILVESERANKIDSVEDELFRFGRVLEANPELAKLLGDKARPVSGRVKLLDEVVGNRASDWTGRLLHQAVRLSNGRSLDTVVPELAEAAADRRGQGIAVVTAAAPLSGAQRSRLETVLSRIYGRTISVQLEIEPEVLGGLRITVGDEVVDGTIFSRLSAASAGLPS